MTPEEALKQAIDVAGGRSKVAAEFGIRPQAVSQWRRCPDRRVVGLERLTGGRVSRHDIRPDLYPREAA